MTDKLRHPSADDRAEFADEYARLDEEEAKAEAISKAKDSESLLAKAGSAIKSLTTKAKPYTGPATATIGVRG